MNTVKKFVLICLLLVLGLVIYFNSSALAGGRKYVPAVEVSPSPKVEPINSPTPTPSGSPWVDFVPVKNYATTLEVKQIIAAGKLANEVVHSKCFRDFMIHRKLIQTE